MTGKAFAFAVLTCLIGYNEWSVNRLYRSASTWPVVEGTVVNSEIEEWFNPFRRSNWLLGPDQWKRVNYTYSVSGHMFNGSSYTTNPRSTNFNFGTRQFLKEYPSGKKVDVHFNPNEPWIAYLRVDGFGFWDWIAFLFIGYLGYLLIAEFRKRNEYA